MNVFANTEDPVQIVPDKKDLSFIVSMIVFIALNFIVGCGSGVIIDMITKGLSMLG